jgi:hypothetical protein
MVKHLVMWRLRPAESLENKAQIIQAVDAIRVGIAGIRAIEIGFTKYAGCDAADLALYSEFDSWEALAAYDLHPLHQVLRDLIGPIRTERRVVDYEIL